MNPNQRQTVLKLILPALALGILYIYGFGRPLNQKIQSLKDSIAAAEKSAPKPVAEAQLLAKLTAARQDIARLKESQKPGVDPAKGGTAQFDRAEYGKRLSAALEKHHLVLLEESAEPSPGPLPPGLAPATAKAPPGAPEPPRVEGGARSIRFTGRYMDVLAALQELDEPGHRALPLRVSMAREETGYKALVWTLVIWL